MVVELIIDHFKAEKKPWEVFFIGVLYTFLAILLSLWVFKSYSSIVMVFFIVLASFPLFFFTTKSEEEKDVIITPEKKILKNHARALEFFMFLFIGVVFGSVIAYVVLPANIVQVLFKVQTETIQQINGGATSIADAFKPVTSIFFNNMKVLVFSIIFSLLYGVGALFILIWNATVLGAAIGNFIRVNIELVAVYEGFTKTASYFQIFSIGFARYAVHGIPEILAYFVGGLAGGILSFAIINKDFKSPNIERIITDTSYLILLAVGLLALAALIEVFVTPTIF